MPLYVRDDDVLALAVELQKLTNAPSKTEAVRLALRHEIERARKSMSIRERLARARAKAREIGRLTDDQADDAFFLVLRRRSRRGRIDAAADAELGGEGR